MTKTIYHAGYRRLIVELRQARVAKGLTQAEVGQWIGRSRCWVQEVESCAVRLDVLSFVRVCQAVGVRAGRLISRLAKEPSG